MAGFADSSRGGPRVTLRLADRADLDKFIGAEGKRFMAVLVEIGDDETPAEQPAPAVRRERMPPLCEWAVLRCREPKFQEWIRRQYDLAMGGNGRGWGDVTPENDFGGKVDLYAAHAVKVLARVESRRELDADPAAGAHFKRAVMEPYGKWLKTEGAEA